MNFLVSNTMIKILIGCMVAVLAAAWYESPKSDNPCTVISNFPGRSAVYECPQGLSSVFLHSGKPIYVSLTTNVASQAWLTVGGDRETEKTLVPHLGAPVVLGPGGFMAIGTGNGLVYIKSATQVLVSLAYDAPNN